MPCNRSRNISTQPGHEVSDDRWRTSCRCQSPQVHWRWFSSKTVNCELRNTSFPDFCPLTISICWMSEQLSSVVSDHQLPIQSWLTIPSKWHIWSEAFSPESFPVKQLALWDTPSGTSCRRGASNMFLWIARILFTKVHSDVASSSVLKFRNILNRQSLSKYWKTLKKQQFMFLHPLLSSYPSHNHYSVENDNSVRETNLGGIPIFYSLPWLPWFLQGEYWTISSSSTWHSQQTDDIRCPSAPSSHQLRPCQRQPTQLPFIKTSWWVRSWKQTEDFFT